MRSTVLEISKKAFMKNVDAVKNYINNKAEVMPVIKANAYGTYLNKEIDLMQNFKIVAVAIVDEALELRKLGFTNDIFVLNQPYIDELEEIEQNNIVVGCSSIEFLKAAKESNRKIRIHIELETGMGRTGVLENNLDEFISTVVSASNISVEGIYTHLSSPDCDEEFTREQLEKFNAAIPKIKSYFPNMKYIHSEASNGLLNFELGECNVVRAGLILYGYPSSDTTLERISLKPVAKLKSKVSFLKDVEAGQSISYGRSFIADKNMKVATVGIGYADGIRRTLSNNGFVVVNNQKCRIIGKVCMDSFMIDVSHVDDVKINDEVYIFDNKNITLQDVAEKYETINYEVLSTIGERVPRIFID